MRNPFAFILRIIGAIAIIWFGGYLYQFFMNSDWHTAVIFAACTTLFLVQLKLLFLLITPIIKPNDPTKNQS